MSRKIFIALGMILTFAFNNACSDDANNPTENSTITETQAVQKAQLTNSGRVTRTELTTHNGVKVWEIYMTTSTGGELKIKYRVDNGTMAEMKGISPSFEYEVQPGMNLINYFEAKSVSLNAKSGQIQSWKLEKDESDKRWEYKFFILTSGQEWEIRIDASSGVLLRIK